MGAGDRRGHDGVRSDDLIRVGCRPRRRKLRPEWPLGEGRNGRSANGGAVRTMGPHVHPVAALGARPTEDS